MRSSVTVKVDPRSLTNTGSASQPVKVPDWARSWAVTAQLGPGQWGTAVIGFRRSLIVSDTPPAEWRADFTFTQAGVGVTQDQDARYCAWLQAFTDTADAAAGEFVYITFTFSDAEFVV